MLQIHARIFFFYSESAGINELHKRLKIYNSQKNVNFAARALVMKGYEQKYKKIYVFFPSLLPPFLKKYFL